jgi:predicted transcriptional regulator
MIYTDLLNASKLSTKGFSKYLRAACENHLIRADHSARAIELGYKHQVNTKGLKIVYSITEQGQGYLRKYEKLKDLVNWRS